MKLIDIDCLFENMYVFSYKLFRVYKFRIVVVETYTMIISFLCLFWWNWIQTHQHSTKWHLLVLCKPFSKHFKYATIFKSNPILIFPFFRFLQAFISFYVLPSHIIWQTLSELHIFYDFRNHQSIE